MSWLFPLNARRNPSRLDSAPAKAASGVDTNVDVLEWAADISVLSI